MPLPNEKKALSELVGKHLRLVSNVHLIFLGLADANKLLIKLASVPNIDYQSANAANKLSVIVRRLLALLFVEL
jgi:hypothetical protein